MDVISFILIAFVASLLMSYVPARRAARVPIAEALRYE
jgi:ABC-type lipoprotein release transport system permease subunit